MEEVTGETIYVLGHIFIWDHLKSLELCPPVCLSVYSEVVFTSLREIDWTDLFLCVYTLSKIYWRMHPFIYLIILFIYSLACLALYLMCTLSSRHEKEPLTHADSWSSRDSKHLKMNRIKKWKETNKKDTSINLGMKTNNKKSQF